MGEAARLPYSISQRTLFLLLKSRSQAQSSDLTCIEMTQEGRYTLCQILAYSRIRKKSKALGFKPRFVEEVQPSQSKTTCCSFASKHIVALTCPCISCTFFHNVHPLQFKSHFHYNRFLFFFLLTSVSHAFQ